MLTRVITGLIGIPIVIALVFWPGGVPFALLIAVASFLGMLEFYGGARKHNIRPHIVLGMIAGMLVLYFGWSWKLFEMMDLIYLIPTFTGLVLLSLIFELFRGHRSPMINVSVTIFGVAYIALLMLHFIWLRNLEGSVTVASRTMNLGAWYVMFVLLTSWALDTGAYFSGKFYGRHKLAPSLSPGKTWEGSIGGFACALIVAAVVGAVIHMPQPHALILGALIGVFGQVGDLTESAIKREIGVKDFGALLPGHGGVMDRLDSLLFTAPIAFWYIVTFLAR
jgi:phosphatidate cytidylyltransferase